jgi:Amt family ammonium transporter
MTEEKKDMKVQLSMRAVSFRLETQFSTPPQTSALQKLLLIIGAGIFIALASLTASLPLPLRSHQDNNPTYATSDGDTAWIIVATIFGLLAAPAATYLFMNLYNIKPSSLMQTVVLTTSIISFVWVIISFSLVWAHDTWDDKLLGFPIKYYMFARLGPGPVSTAPTIPSAIFAVFELCFAVIAPTIIAAAVSERVTIYGFLAFIFTWHVCIYCPVAYITWNHNGWLYTNSVQDFSGGVVTNQLAAITILVLNRYLDWKSAPKRVLSAPTNRGALLFSALAFWFLSFGLNAGKAYGANAVAAQSVVNTIASVFISIFLSYLWNELFTQDFSATEISNSILLGLIASTPSSGYVTVGGSMVITIITVLVVRLVAKFLLKEGENGEAFSFESLYGIGGIISFLFTGLICYAFVNGKNGLTHGFDGSADVIRYHTATVLTLWSTAPIAVAICAYLCDLFVPLSRAEQQGTDFTPIHIGPFRPESAIMSTADIYRVSSQIISKDGAEK